LQYPDPGIVFNLSWDCREPEIFKLGVACKMISSLTVAGSDTSLK